MFNSCGKHFGLCKSIVRSIKKKEETITKGICSAIKSNMKLSSYKRDVILKNVEQASVIQIKDNL